MISPYQVVQDFEAALCEYTGAPYAVTTNSCTSALFLSLMWWRGAEPNHDMLPEITIPKRTYVSVPMQIKHAGYRLSFSDLEWKGAYRLEPLNHPEIWDCARRFTSGMYVPGQMQCLSFHWSKILGIQQGGAILHDKREADIWLRRARFDGRTEGVAPKNDVIETLGWHMYMSPEIAAEGLVRLSFLPKYNEDMPNDDYPDLSTMEVFK
jgi:dTDP-4-amino-4,6-dideoxygalactose transaminase